MFSPCRDQVDILVEKAEFGLRSWTISTAARKIFVLKIYPDGPDAGLLDGEGALSEGVIWIDLLNPSAQEIALVEQKGKCTSPRAKTSVRSRSQADLQRRVTISI